MGPKSEPPQIMGVGQTLIRSTAQDLLDRGFFSPLPGSSPLLPVSGGSGAEKNRECNLTWSLHAGTLFQYLAVLGIARFPLDSLGGVSKDVVLGLVWCSLGAKRKININFNHSDGENLQLPKQNTGSTYPGGLFLQCTGMKDMYQHFSFQSFNSEKQFSMITTFQPGMV